MLMNPVVGEVLLQQIQKNVVLNKWMYVSLSTIQIAVLYVRNHAKMLRIDISTDAR